MGVKPVLVVWCLRKVINAGVCIIVIGAGRGLIGSDGMKLTMDIPIDFERDFINDKFKDFFSRVIADIDCSSLCGNYEKEIAEMLLKAFYNAAIED